MPRPNKKSSTFEVEAIIGKKYDQEQPFYLIKWKGYQRDESTWETLAHLEAVMDMVADYEKKQVKSSKQEEQNSSTICEKPFLSDIFDQIDSPPNQHGISQTIPNFHTLQIKSSRKVLVEEQTDNSEDCFDRPSINFKQIHIDQKHNFNTWQSLKEEDELNQQVFGNSPQLLTLKASHQKNNKKKQKEIKNVQKLFCEEKKHKKEKKLKKKTSKIERKIQKMSKKKSGEQQKVMDNGELFEQEANLIGESKKLGVEKVFEKVRLEDMQESVVKIRWVQSLPGMNGSMNDYLVEYGGGALKVYNTYELVVTHPIAFITYLERKANS